MIVSNFNIYKIFLCLLIAFSILAAGCNDASNPEPLTNDRSVEISKTKNEIALFDPAIHNWPSQHSDIPISPDVNLDRLDNGLRLAILDIPTKENIVSLYFDLGVGFNDETEDHYGIAHLVEHMMFRNESGGQSVIHDLQSMGIEFGKEFNGYTTDNRTFYVLDLIDPNESDLAGAIEKFKALILNIKFSADDLELEKKIVLAELNRQKNIDSERIRSKALFQSPHNLRLKASGAGTAESIETINLDELRLFYETHYTPNNSLFIVAGNVNPASIIATISDSFGTWQNPDIKDILDGKSDVTISSFPETGQFVDSETTTSLMAVENKATELQADSYERRLANFELSLVQGMLRRRINARTDKNKYVEWINFSRRTVDGLDTRTVEMSGKDYEKAIKIFEEERLRAIKFGFTENEIKHRLKSNRGRLANKAHNKIAARLRASEFARNYRKGEVYNSPEQDLMMFDEFSGSTNNNDYSAKAKDIWANFNPRYWMSMRSRPVDVIQKVRIARKSVLGANILPQEDSENTFNLPELGKPGRITKRDVLRAHNTTRILYSNGVRLNYSKTASQDDLIMIAITFDRDFESLSLDYSWVAERIKAYSKYDIKGITKTEIDQEYAGQKIDFRFLMLEDRLALVAATSQNDLSDILELLTAFIQNVDHSSKWNSKNYEAIYKRSQKSRKFSALSAGVKELSLQLSNKSPSMETRSNGGSRRAVESVQAIIDNYLKHGAIEIGVIGNFEPKALETKFAETFGALPRPDQKTPASKPRKNIISLPPGHKVIDYNGTHQQMANLFCWTRSEVNTYEQAIRDINQEIVFNRVFETLRQDLGLTYSPTKANYNNSAFPEFSYQCFGVQFEPKDEMAIRQAFNDIIQGLTDNPVDEDEFRRAKSPVLSGIDRIKSQPYANFDATAFAHTKPKKLDRIADRAKAIEKVKLKSVQKSINNDFDLKNANIFRVISKSGWTQSYQQGLEIASKFGDAQAQFELGKKLIDKNTPADTAKAIALFEKSAEQDNKLAHLQLAKHFMQNDKDLTKAAFHFEKSENNKVAKGLLAGIYYRNPDLFPNVSDEEIMELYLTSSKNGDFITQNELARRYKDGTIVKRDNKAAYRWAVISAYLSGGITTDLNRPSLNKFKSDLTDEEAETARVAAEEWARAYWKRSK